MQGAQIFRNEAYIEVRRMTKDEVQRSKWTFYEVVSINYYFNEDYDVQKGPLISEGFFMSIDLVRWIN